MGTLSFLFLFLSKAEVEDADITLVELMSAGEEFSCSCVSWIGDETTQTKELSIGHLSGMTNGVVTEQVEPWLMISQTLDVTFF